jgi:hypothetical protein
MRQVGLLRFTYESLAQFMNLPEGNVITAVVPQSADHVGNQEVAFIVSGKDMPTTPEGTTVPVVALSRDSSGGSSFI